MREKGKYYSVNNKIEHPTLEDAQKLYESLSKCFYIRNKHTLEPIPIFSLIHKEGLPCPILSSKDECTKLLEDMKKAYQIEELELASINSIWDFILLCASNGICGAVYDNQIGINFYNRLSDMG